MSAAPRVTTVVGALAMLLAGCAGEVRPEIAVGIDACAACNMVIDQPRQAAGYVRDARFVAFDSPICLLRSYESLRRNGETPPAAVYFADHDDATLHPAEEVVFLLTRHVQTAMGGGVLCFADRKAAEATGIHEDDTLTDWTGFQVARGEPDRVLEASFHHDGMTPSVLEAAKGELLLWKVRSSGLAEDLVVAVKGYPEVGEVTLPASGEEVRFRLRALRPGSGFPVVRASGGEPLGMLKVSGAHTADEDAR